MNIIEIVGADAMWEKAKKIRDELDRKERERQEKASFEELQKAIDKIQQEIEKAVNKGEFYEWIWFEEEKKYRIYNDEKIDEWFYLEKGNITKIIELFSIAGYNIRWEENKRYSYTYGKFIIRWEMEE